MLIDLHAHSSGISKCCRIPFEDVLKQALSVGIDGIVLTNHYQKSYISDSDAAAFASKYTAEFYAAKQYGEQIGCKVFFGIEMTMEKYKGVHMLIYGVEPDFLLKHPALFDCTQAQLYRTVKACNGVVVQAHPFRNGTAVMDTALLDGVEINCHPLYKQSHAAELTAIAEKNHLILTCGGDYHADTYRPRCGMILPDDLESNIELGRFLASDRKKKLYVQEPNSTQCICLHVDPKVRA